MEALNNMDGLVNLRNLVQEVKKTTTANKSVPIVFGKWLQVFPNITNNVIKYLGSLVGAHLYLVPSTTSAA